MDSLRVPNILVHSQYEIIDFVELEKQFRLPDGIYCLTSYGSDVNWYSDVCPGGFFIRNVARPNII